MLVLVDELAVRIGQQIKAARKQAKLSQGRLAELVDVSLRAVQQWESGERRCSLDHLRAIAVATNVRLGYLTGDVEPAPGGAATAADIAALKADISRLEAKVDEVLRRLPPPTHHD